MLAKFVNKGNHGPGFTGLCGSDDEPADEAQIQESAGDAFPEFFLVWKCFFVIW